MNIETMRLLVAKGLSAEDILEIAETMATAPKARSAAAERQARYRARQKEECVTESVTRDVTRYGDSVTPPPLSRPPNENISNPPTHTPEKQTPARKGRRLPVDWQPGPLTGDVGSAVECWPPGALDRELARFRDWAASASGPNAIKSDWQAAWRNWIRKAHDEGRHGRNRTKPNGADRDEIQNPYVRAAIARQNRSAAAVGG